MNEYKVKTQSKEYKITFAGKNSGTIDNKPFLLDAVSSKQGSYHIIKDHKSYNIEVLKADYKEKSMLISVNGNNYALEVKDKFDELLKSLGFDNLKSGKVNEIKAPMPGLVLDICVIQGQEIKKGDAMLVLEAMKMENILKSPADGKIKKIVVNKGVAVEKNQTLITFE